MAELPTMAIRTDALLGDTGHLSATEFGAYVRLLLAMWRNGSWLPADEKRLARYATLTAGQWSRSGPVLMEFFTDIGNDRITQGKLANEFAEAVAKSSSAADSADARWARRRAGRVAVEQQAGLPSDSPENNIHPKPLENKALDDANALPTHSERNALQDPGSRSKIHGGGGAREEDLHDEIVMAVGVDPVKDTQLRFVGSDGIAQVALWRGLGLSQAEILTVIRETMMRKRDGPPSNLRFFDKPMQRAAGLKLAPPLAPIIPIAATEETSRARPPSRQELTTDAWTSGASLDRLRSG